MFQIELTIYILILTMSQSQACGYNMYYSIIESSCYKTAHARSTSASDLIISMTLSIYRMSSGSIVTDV